MPETRTRDLPGSQRSLRQAIEHLDKPALGRARRVHRAAPQLATGKAATAKVVRPWVIVLAVAAVTVLLAGTLLAA
jgi:hypothetical protein